MAWPQPHHGPCVGRDSSTSHETLSRYGKGSNYFIYTTDLVYMSSPIYLYVACSNSFTYE